MIIGNSKIEYFVDYINKKVHLLDLDNFGTRSLTNAICPEFQNKLIEQENLLKDVVDFEWICYGTDGIIASYKEYNFKYCNPKLPYLHEPYKEVMKKRKERYK